MCYRSLIQYAKFPQDHTSTLTDLNPAWLTIATRASWPVSTTYSIVSAVVGVGIATGGWDAPRWGWNGAKGLAAIWAGMVIGERCFMHPYINGI